ncbi:MAG: TIGR02680 family protein [Ottowia sp.]|nr:TIGR02680 family protein [Ottowia sp.]
MSAPLPQPRSRRWQPLRLGLVELYYYDVEEFWFEDGHLLLRGNNGTGKSKVLSLTLPFLLDASLSPARLEPDADPAKRMQWNLLMGSRYKRRTGYAWLEFGRVDAGGTPRFVTVGAGLRATAGRPQVDAWYFNTERRVGQGLQLVDENQTVATQERLREMLGRHCVHTAVGVHRHAVDERLFGLGDARYKALLDTLIQLRQPQLSKQPNEDNLSRALSQAFAPLPRPVLEDVAAALNQLDDHRSELQDYSAMHEAVSRFNGTYRHYAQILARRRARDLRQVQTAFDNASAAARQAQHRHDAAQAALQEQEQELAATQTRQGEVSSQANALQRSPEMRDAHALHQARQAAESAGHNAARAQQDAVRAGQRLQEEQKNLARWQESCQASAQRLRHALGASREQASLAGMADAHARSWSLHDTDTPGPEQLARQPQDRRSAAFQVQRELAAKRDEQIALVRARLAAAQQALQEQRMAQREHDARSSDSNAAEQDRAAAERQVLDAGQAHIAAWQAFAVRVAHHLGSAVAQAWPDAGEALADWVNSLDGASPLASHWSMVEAAERDTLAATDADLRQQRQALETERAPLLSEQKALREGSEASPLAPLTRGAERSGRAGAPLWQLVDFVPDTDAAARAGLEAALQASGLLDAWVSPEGVLLAPDTQDAWLVPESTQELPATTPTLATLLQPDPAARDSGVAAARVHAVLARIAITDAAATGAAATAWAGGDGRYRIGPLQGAWRKPAAEHIGYAARQAARQRRLEQIANRLQILAGQERGLLAAQEALAARRSTLGQLAGSQPTAEQLRNAHAALAAAERRAAQARARLAEAQARLQSAREASAAAQDALVLDATDTALPTDPAALSKVADAVQEYRLAATHCEATLDHHAQALVEQVQQQARVTAAGTELEQAREHAGEQRRQAAAAQALHQELARSVGAGAADVLARLGVLEQEARALKTTLETVHKNLAATHKSLGAAGQAVTDTGERLQAEHERRAACVGAFQAFAGTGLLRAAAPSLALPAGGEPWTLDAALGTARAAEAALGAVDDADPAWQRVQGRLGDAFAELQRALSAQGHECFGEPGDHGYVVRIRFNQRNEAPDALQAVLQAEISERRTLLTARETEVIENHLQAEIAAQLQALIRAADDRVKKINAELARRPTSTGVKFKLVWEALHGEDASLASLAAVRQLLINKVADAWSPADRAQVGAFLQGRIDAERERDAASARIDQLAAALDYRAWHRFRVRRWQDGQWKPLSGPASSGERALGLTVPLFAAAASHYESAAAHAPRLVLLDEAFAGIDDAARAHCMALIREFDLDFVMTSEREWGCYAELPGVAICHLVRRADVDAVHVSRWRWNGRTRERAELPPTASAASAAPADETELGFSS